MIKKSTFLFISFFLFIISSLYAVEATQIDPSLYPEFYYPNNNSFFHLWSNPDRLVFNNSLQFHSSLTTGVYTSLSTLSAVLNGDYPLIAYWIDQFSAGGYGVGTSLDIGIEGKYWSVGINGCINTFTKGPQFPEVSFGNCTLTASLYAGIAYPFKINDFDISIGTTLMPLYRLKVPMTTETYTTLLLNIMTWSQDKLKNLLKDIPLYQGIGFGLNTNFMLHYKNASVQLLLDNLFDTHIYYKKFDLGNVMADPGLLLSSFNTPLDHIGRIPMDISLSGSYELKLPYTIVKTITLGCGFHQFKKFIYSRDKVFPDLISLTSEIQFFSFMRLIAAMYRGSFYINLLFSLPLFEINMSFSTAMNNSDNYSAPKNTIVLGIYFYY